MKKILQKLIIAENYNITNSGNSWQISTSLKRKTATPISATGWFVVYDNSNRLIGVKKIDINLNYTNPYPVLESLTVGSNAAKAKFFVWSNKLEPLMEIEKI